VAHLERSEFFAASRADAAIVQPDSGNRPELPSPTDGASDFAVNGNYSYDDVPAGQIDLQLAYFSIAHDAPYIIRLLQQALLISRHDRHLYTRTCRIKCRRGRLAV
jgi:hypothetical protein